VEPLGEDTIFETEVTTNRPDWLSHLGVAREVYAIRGGHFAIPSCKAQTRSAKKQAFSVSIKAPLLCPYYSATFLEEVTSGRTPDFMKQRLEACGIRSINLIVDVTNYVLLEWGQPLHAFDADRLKERRIEVRRASAGEKIVAINGVTYELTKDDLVIADSNGAVALGGVMGGAGSELNESTRNILLESAFFKPSTVRSSSRRFGLVSESSYRFERRVDPEGVDLARERAIYLICKYAQVKQVHSVARAGKIPIKSKHILLDTSQVERVLGTRIPGSKVKLLLKRLGLKVSGSAKKVNVVVPSFRNDLTRPIDLIEEVARVGL